MCTLTARLVSQHGCAWKQNRPTTRHESVDRLARQLRSCTSLAAAKLGREAKMRILAIVTSALVVAVPVYAGPSDFSTFFGAPAIGEAGLLALAVVIGIAGIRMVGKHQRK